MLRVAAALSRLDILQRQQSSQPFIVSAASMMWRRPIATEGDAADAADAADITGARPLAGGRYDAAYRLVLGAVFDRWCSQLATVNSRSQSASLACVVTQYHEYSSILEQICLGQEPLLDSASAAADTALVNADAALSSSRAFSASSSSSSSSSPRGRCPPPEPQHFPAGWAVPEHPREHPGFSHSPGHSPGHREHSGVTRERLSLSGVTPIAARESGCHGVLTSEQLALLQASAGAAIDSLAHLTPQELAREMQVLPPSA
jgi:hypothetical protein